MIKVRGIDSIRALAAIWVFLSHLGKIPLESHLGTGRMVSLLLSIYGTLFNGTAAVVIFFIISGICIRLASQAESLELGPFWVRRFVRVGGPLLCAVGLSHFVFGSTDVLDAVLWSLYCELIYYFIYPFLCSMASKIGWPLMIVTSLIAACALVSVKDDHNGFLWTYGVGLSWILGLPSWLLGVYVADNLRAPGWMPTFWPRRALWGAMWLASSVALVAHFHSPLSYKYTMIPFGLMASWWLLVELRAAANEKENAILTWIGTWSYSLYLCHKIAIGLIVMAGFSIEKELLAFAAALILGLVMSYAFFRLIERPFHELARRLSKGAPVIFTTRVAAQ
ncbi:acyltransferase [Massilia sp. R2A-15]|uniref:acyltransferase family protein n=1 Tax=Massilia sp. R2A-15 TaxID=3064278 RepID=UPI0027350727|nr:acyltransferase [Massilia sp. R2A-15]WLI88016.1 acyltransferase [Massilia sp. R2A-15]